MKKLKFFVALFLMFTLLLSGVIIDTGVVLAERDGSEWAQPKAQEMLVLAERYALDWLIPYYKKIKNIKDDFKVFDEYTLFTMQKHSAFNGLLFPSWLRMLSKEFMTVGTYDSDMPILGFLAGIREYMPKMHIVAIKFDKPYYVLPGRFRVIPQIERRYYVETKYFAYDLKTGKAYTMQGILSSDKIKYTVNKKCAWCLNTEDKRLLMMDYYAQMQWFAGEIVRKKIADWAIAGYSGKTGGGGGAVYPLFAMKTKLGWVPVLGNDDSTANVLHDSQGSQLFAFKNVPWCASIDDSEGDGDTTVCYGLSNVDSVKYTVGTIDNPIDVVLPFKDSMAVVVGGNDWPALYSFPLSLLPWGKSVFFSVPYNSTVYSLKRAGAVGVNVVSGKAYALATGVDYGSYLYVKEHKPRDAYIKEFPVIFYDNELLKKLNAGNMQIMKIHSFIPYYSDEGIAIADVKIALTGGRGVKETVLQLPLLIKLTTMPADNIKQALNSVAGGRPSNIDWVFQNYDAVTIDEIKSVVITTFTGLYPVLYTASHLYHLPVDQLVLVPYGTDITQVFAVVPKKPTSTQYLVIFDIDETGTLQSVLQGVLGIPSRLWVSSKFDYRIFAPMTKDGYAFKNDLEQLILKVNSQEIIQKYENGTYRVFTTELPLFIDPKWNRTMLPLRFVSEAMGYKVEWVSNERKIIIRGLDANDNDMTVIMYMPKNPPEFHGKLNTGAPLIVYPGSSKTTILKNGKQYTVDLAAKGLGVPYIFMDRTFVPLRFISEIFGNTVQWDPVTRLITIQFNRGKAIPRYYWFIVGKEEI